jgi:hypothetical protein
MHARFGHRSPHRHAERGQRERGSVLMLMPAAVLIVLLLGAIAVDLTVVHLRQRAAISAAGSAANDAVTYGLDQAALRRGEGYRLVPERVRRAVAESIESQGLADDLAQPPEVTEPAPGTVTVVLHVRAAYLFARALPHGPTDTVVTATATATVDQR